MPPWTKELILDAFARWMEEVGEVPGCEDWETRRSHPHWLRHRGQFPTTPTVAKYFGTWRKGVEAAGLQPRKSGRPKGLTNAQSGERTRATVRKRLRARRAALREELKQTERELAEAA